MARRRGTGRRGLVALGAVGVLLAGVVAGPSQATTARPADPDRMRVNDVQVIGTHNSYHQELSDDEVAAFDEVTGGSYDDALAYSHPTIPDQLALQGVRGLELDLFGDPDGGLYAEPLLRRSLGLGPLPDPAWREPGTKVFHVADLDYDTTCVQLTTCLEQLRDFSRSEPTHVPLMIMLELKTSDPAVVAGGGVQSPAWDAAALDRLDGEIRSVFDEDEILTPDDVRRPGRTLEESVTQAGWPRLASARGQVIFLLDNEGALNDVYAEGRPSLQGRVVFTNSTPGRPDAAFLKRNEPRGEQTAQIADLVRQGYLVRTRSDVPLETVRSGSTEMREAAVASGAHLVSTDFPEVGMSARYDSRFVATLPTAQGPRAHGSGTVRCNPVSAPRTCREGQLER